MSPDKLVAENLYLSIGQKNILNGVSVSIEKGSITALLGRNGSGKSTTLQSIFGVRHPQECSLFLNGGKVSKPYLTDGLINYLPQHPFLPLQLSLRKIAQQFNVSLNDITDIFPELEADIDKKTRELSGGTERLFSVLICLMTENRFCMLDEPFSHIMPLHVDRLKELMLRQKQNKGILITDHLYGHLLDISDSIYLMKEGRSILIKNTDDLALHGYVNSPQS